MSLNRLSDSRLSLNERRKPFAPTVWELPSDDTKTDLRQVWFPGCHGDVGGGKDEHALSNNTLAWMIEQVKSIPRSTLEFDENYVLNRGRTIAQSNKTKPWGCADYKDSYNSIWELAGTTRRHPSRYDDKAKMEVHKSVEVRSTWSKSQPEPWPCPNLGKLKFTTLRDGGLESRMQDGFPPGPL
jgi:Uncharacterized alpha/beta hydrolase domain (DUF2235)